MTNKAVIGLDAFFSDLERTEQTYWEHQILIKNKKLEIMRCIHKGK